MKTVMAMKPADIAGENRLVRGSAIIALYLSTKTSQTNRRQTNQLQKLADFIVPGLEILVDSLLTDQTSDGVRAQGWQTLCLIVQNVKDWYFCSLPYLPSLFKKSNGVSGHVLTCGCRSACHAGGSLWTIPAGRNIKSAVCRRARSYSGGAGSVVIPWCQDKFIAKVYCTNWDMDIDMGWARIKMNKEYEGMVQFFFIYLKQLWVLSLLSGPLSPLTALSSCFPIRQENLHLCISALKAVGMRTTPGMQFERAMQFAAHYEGLVRTFKEQDEVLRIALDMIAQTLLGRALVFLVYYLLFTVHCIDGK